MRIFSTLLRNALSLKAKLATGVALLFGLMVALLTLFQLHETRAAMKELLSAQQTTLVTRTAEEIDEKFRDRRTALTASAAGIASYLERDISQAPMQLRDRRALQTMFDTVIIIGLDGRVLAVEPENPGLRKLNLTHRPYFDETLLGRRSVISQPYRSAASGRPFVTMTAPVYDSNGKIIAVLAGAISLLKENFLGDIGTTPVGRTGYFYVVTRGENAIIVSHPNRNRILGPAASPEQNSSIALARAGFEGTVEGVNSTGVPGLMSFKRLRETDWLLAAILPAHEAFAPIEESQARTLFAGGAVMLIVAAAVWFMVRRALRPLDALRSHVRERIENPQAGAPMPVRNQDEIGELTFDFNRLMTRRQEIEHELALNQERLLTITDNLPVLIGYIDRDLRFRFNNQAYEEWYGFTRAQMQGAPVRLIIGEREFGELEPTLSAALSGYPTQKALEIEANGRRRHVLGTYLPHYGKNNEVKGIHVLVHDVTEQKTAAERLEYLASHDPLTALVNRGAFTRRLELAIKRVARAKRPYGLMYLDIDHFKTINDTYGHGVGDLLLQAFAGRLSAAVRQTDVVGRLGGDEFVLLLEDMVEAADGYLVGQKVVDAMHTPFELDGATVRATTSVGITLFTAADAGLTPAELLHRADRALYEAKAAGRNTFRIGHVA